MSRGKWTDKTRVKWAVKDFVVESFVAAWDWDYIWEFVSSSLVVVSDAVLPFS